MITTQWFGNNEMVGIDDISITSTAIPAPNVTPTAIPQSPTTLEDTPVTITLTGDDNDGGTQGLTFVIDTLPSTGVITTTGGGAIAAPFTLTNLTTGTAAVRYTPLADFAGAAADGFTFHVEDGQATDATSTAATVTINLTPVNDPPTFDIPASPDQLFLPSSATTVAGFLTNLSLGGGADEAFQDVILDIVTDNDALFAPGGRPTIDLLTGALSCTTSALTGVANVTITALDDGGDDNGGSDTSAPRTFTITVSNGPNTPPTFIGGASDVVAEDFGDQIVFGWATAISVSTTGSTGEESQTLDFIVTNDSGALFATQPFVEWPSGDLVYETAPNAFGVATVTVTARDSGGTSGGGNDTSAPFTFTITITPVNDPPTFDVAGNVTVSLPAAATSVADFATNFSFGPANEAPQFLQNYFVSNNNNSLFAAQPTIDGSGTLTFTPGLVTGSAVVTVVAFDTGAEVAPDDNESAPRTFTITVTDLVNTAPSFSALGAQTVLEDAGPRTVTGWAFDISNGGTPADAGQTVTFTVVNDAPALFTGPVVVSANGDLIFTPAADAFGTASLTVTAQDSGDTSNGGQNTSAPFAFTITVTAVNDRPLLFIDNSPIPLLEDAAPVSRTGFAAATKGAANEDALQTITYTATTDNPGLFQGGGVAISAGGDLTFTLAANAFGTARVTVTAQDNGGIANGGLDTSLPQTFTVTVTAVNDRPTFVKGADESVLEDAGPRVVTGWATAISTGAANETQTVTFTATADLPALFSGPVVVSANGDLLYTPASNAFGVAVVTVFARDSGDVANGGIATSTAALLTITLTAVNDPPTFTITQPSITIAEDAGPQAITVAASISAGPLEPGQAIAFTVTSTNAALFSALPTVATSTGIMSFTTAANAFGASSITLTLIDNGGTAFGGNPTSTSQVISLTVNSRNDAPSFVKGADQSVFEDATAQTVVGWATSISPGVGAADEAGQALTFNVSSNNSALFAAQPQVASNGTLTYTPAANAFGSATVTVTLSDDGGTANGGTPTSTAQTFTIAVSAVNDAPSFTKGPDQSVNEDVGARSIAGWATGLSAGPANEAAQLLTFQVTANSNGALFSVQPSVASNGTLTYTPAANANGSATVTLRIFDNGLTANGGVDASATQTFTIAVAAVNDAPAFTRGANQTVAEDAGPQSVAGWATAISRGGGADEAAQALTFLVSATNPTLFATAPSVAASGTLTYTAAANANGTSTVTVRLQDDGGTANTGVDTSAAQTFTITVTPQDDPPVAVSFTRVTGEETPVAVSLSAIEPDGEPISFTVTSQPAAASGTLSGTAPALTFTPAPYFTGSVQLTYTARDGATTSAPATVTITVEASEGRIVALIENPDAATGDDFGGATAFVQDLVAIGAAGDDPGAVGDAGAVYLFDAATGAPEGEIDHPAPAAGDGFGSALAAFQATLVVGAPGRAVNGIAGAGAVYVFDPIARTLLFTIDNPAPVAGAAFGSAIAADGARIVVGAPFATSGGVVNAGAVYVFQGGNGVLLRTIENPQPTAGDEFGRALASGSIFVGAPGDDAGAADAGAVYQFDASTGALQRTIVNPGPASGAGFGAALATAGGSLLVGAPGGAGAVVVLDKATGQPLRTIANPAPATGDGFGAALATAGLALVVGAPEDDPLGAVDAGALFAFDPTTGAAALPAAVTGAAGEAFGRAMASSAAGGFVAAGAPSADVGATPDAGALSVVDANLRPKATAASVVLGTGGSAPIVLQGTDANGDALTFKVITQPVSGTLTGTVPDLVYTPPAGFSGIETLRFTVRDGRLTSQPATVQFVVGGTTGSGSTGGGGGGGGCVAARPGAGSPWALLPAVAFVLGALLVRARRGRPAPGRGAQGW